MKASGLFIAILSALISVVSTFVIASTTNARRLSSQQRCRTSSPVPSATTLWQAKVITCRTSDDDEFEVVVSNQKSFEKLCQVYDVAYLVDEMDRRIYDFVSLKSAAIYKLEPDATISLESGSFDFSTLRPPLEVLLPPRIDDPAEFICEDDWWVTTTNLIYSQLDRYDDDSYRVAPLALVCCSSGGKTRAVNEIAYAMAENDDRPVNAIYITFKDYSPVSLDDINEPLQALCRRILFAATRVSCEEPDLASAYDSFRQKNYNVDPYHFVKWLGDARVILLIDELSYLTELDAMKSEKAAEFGDFVREKFLAPVGRYCIFTSQKTSTIDSLRRYMDRGMGSRRGVQVQTLPRIKNLSRARLLDPSLQAPEQAVYYDLIPGLLHDQRESGEATFDYDSRRQAVAAYNEEAEHGNADELFKMLLSSVVSGTIRDIPQPLHILFDARVKNGKITIRWILFHLEYVLRNALVNEESWIGPVKIEMANLCRALKEAAVPGKGYKDLFALMFLIRSIAGDFDDHFLPSSWINPFMPVQVAFNAFNDTVAGTWLANCTTWEQLRRGVVSCNIVKTEKSIVVIYPLNALFGQYDLIALYLEGRTIVDSRGFAVTTSMALPGPAAVPEVQCSFFVSAIAPGGCIDNMNGWNLPSASVVDSFYGESGEYWTPRMAKLLVDTFC